MPEFIEWPKTARLFRTIVVTEKIDGTNACVQIEPVLERDVANSEHGRLTYVDGQWYGLTAQSRKRIILPGADNYGFAGWVHANASALVRALGAGVHFGEWWGKGIQRRYGLETNAFSLFNTDRHSDVNTVIDGCPVRPVPVLYHGTYSEGEIRAALHRLDMRGSVAAPGFANPEGICVFHSQAKRVFKVTLDNFDAGKWEVA